MQLDPRGLDWNELALRFSAHLPGVTSCIVGTGKLAHFKRNIEILAQGPLDAQLQQHIREAFVRHGGQWSGMI